MPLGKSPENTAPYPKPWDALPPHARGTGETRDAGQLQHALSARSRYCCAAIETRAMPLENAVHVSKEGARWRQAARGGAAGGDQHEAPTIAAHISSHAPFAVASSQRAVWLILRPAVERASRASRR